MPKSNPENPRKELVENLLLLLQNSSSQQFSGDGFTGSVDVLSNKLHGLSQYCRSLKDACTVIAGVDPEPNDLSQVIEICEAAVEGAGRVQQYLDEIRVFGTDLDNMRRVLNDNIIELHNEVV